MTLLASGMLETGAKIRYLCMLFCGEALCQFDSLSVDMESTETLTVEYIIKGLTLYPPPVIFLSKQKLVMRRGIKNLRGLKLRSYVKFLIDLNEYFSFFVGLSFLKYWRN